MGGSDGSNGHDKNGRDGADNVVRMPTLAERDALRRVREEQAHLAAKAAARTEPMINLPPATKALLAAIIFIHAVVALLLDPPQQYWVYEHFGFIPASYTVAFTGWPAFAGPFTFLLLHGGWTHLAMNGAMLMAFGTAAERAFGARRMLALLLVSSLGGAAVQFALDPASEMTIIGASGGLSGLFAAVILLLQTQGRLGGGRYGFLSFAALWIGISVIFGIMGAPDGSPIAWASHIGGFITGLLCFKFIARKT